MVIKLKILLNPDKEIVKEVRKQLIRTGGYCPYMLIRSPATLCMCEDFRAKIADPEFEPKKTAEHVGGFLTYKLTDYISGIANRTILISGCGHTPSTSTNSAEISTTIPPALYCQFDGASRPGCSGACRYRLTATRR